MTAYTRTTYPYVPKVYRDYLASKLDAAVRVTSMVPSLRPLPIVTIWTAPASGSDNPRFFAWRRLVFKCWDSDEVAAGTLCEEVRSFVVDSVYARLGCRRVKVVGEPARFDDPTDSTPRFQTTIDVLFRASVITNP